MNDVNTGEILFRIDLDYEYVVDRVTCGDSYDEDDGYADTPYIPILTFGELTEILTNADNPDALDEIRQRLLDEEAQEREFYE